MPGCAPALGLDPAVASVPMRPGLARSLPVRRECRCCCIDVFWRSQPPLPDQDLPAGADHRAAVPKPSGRSRPRCREPPEAARRRSSPDRRRSRRSRRFRCRSSRSSARPTRERKSRRRTRAFSAIATTTVEKQMVQARRAEARRGRRRREAGAGAEARRASRSRGGAAPAVEHATARRRSPRCPASTSCCPSAVRARRRRLRSGERPRRQAAEQEASPQPTGGIGRAVVPALRGPRHARLPARRPRGDITLLNTKAELFAPFVRRVALRVFQNLLISLRRELQRLGVQRRGGDARGGDEPAGRADRRR